MKIKFLTWFAVAIIWATSIFASTTYASDSTTSTCSETDRTTIKTILDKQKAWETITDTEQATLTSLKACVPQRNKNKSGSWEVRDGSWMTQPPMMQLTDEEKTKLESMTDTEKKAFMESKFGTWMLNKGEEKMWEKWDKSWTWATEKSEKKTWKKDQYKQKLSTNNQTAADNLFNKYVDKIGTKTTDEQISFIDNFLTKVDAAITKIWNSSYSDTTKEKYNNLLNYLKLSFEEKKSELNWDSSDSDSEDNIIDSLLQ